MFPGSGEGEEDRVEEGTCKCESSGKEEEGSCILDGSGVLAEGQLGSSEVAGGVWDWSGMAVDKGMGWIIGKVV